MNTNANRSRQNASSNPQKEALYTPGPYRIERSTDGCDDCWNVVAAGSTRPLVDVRFWDDGGPAAARAEANARLFAAAPEMLEALRLAEASMTAKAGTAYMTSDTLRIVRMAIAKAKGGIQDAIIAFQGAEKGPDEESLGAGRVRNSINCYSGVCPICLCHDDSLMIGTSRWFRCRRHRTKWLDFENSLSRWSHQDDEVWHQNAIELEGYVEVSPVYGVIGLTDRDAEAVIASVARKLTLIERRRLKVPDAAYYELSQVIRHLWDDELRDYRNADMNGRKRHLFRRLVGIHNWLHEENWTPEDVLDEVKN